MPDERTVEWKTILLYQDLPILCFDIIALILGGCDDAESR